MGLLAYLYYFRRNDLPIILAVMPNATGPLLANWYAERYIANAEQLLSSGGDTLVTLAFFWAAVVALFIYLLSKPSTGALDKVGLGVIVLLLAVVVFFGADFSATALLDGPVIFGEVRAPPVTPLLVCRVAITFYSTFEAIRPPLVAARVAQIRQSVGNRPRA